MDESLLQEILNFRNERDWKQFHNPKDLAISLSLEAAELLETFQWSGTDFECREKSDKIREELADVCIYAALIADAYGLDLDTIIREKLKINAEKYPADAARGSAKKYTELTKND